jgi:chaperonin GroEL (HSP60 family)
MLKDEHERLAADFFKEGSTKTNEMVGDGTTTTAVIGGHLINKIFGELAHEDIPLAGQKHRKGVRAMRGEMRDAKDLVIEEIKKQAKPIKTLADLEKIAIVSIGREDDDAAKTVAKMV